MFPEIRGPHREISTIIPREGIQGWDISIVQHGFSKAPYGSARHQRRLKWGSYDV